MQQEVIFITYLCNYGGVETFVIRMTEWLSGHGIPATVITDREREVKKELVREITEAGGKVITMAFRSYDAAAHTYGKNLQAEKTTVISFSYPGFILGEQIRSGAGNKRIASIFYDPHQYGLMMDYWTEQKKWKPVLHHISRYLVQRLEKRHAVIYMDPLCRERTFRTFCLEQVSKSEIELLPVKIKEWDEWKIRKRYREEEFNILTICRMYFPFKGYVLGLLDLFIQLSGKYPNLTLTIIGGGKDQEILEKKISGTDSEIQKRIQWVPGLPYGQLLPYLARASLYVGMGTTVTDALNEGVPALPIGSYTYECRGYGHFYEDYSNLGGIHGKKEITSLVEAVLSMEEEEYLALCRQDYEQFKNHYDINQVGAHFLQFENKTDRPVFHKLERGLIYVGKKLYQKKKG